jgi:transposase InsO family protein
MAKENLILTEAQLVAMERRKETKEAYGEIETEHPGYLGAQDTYYVGNLKGVGRIYQQTFIDTYAKVVHVKLYDHKNALVAADLLNDRVIPFYEAHGIPLLRILTDRGTEYCGRPEYHEYELYLAVENIDHSKTKARHPQTNGICERFHKTILNEFYQIAFRKKNTTHLKNYKMMLIFGSKVTMMKDRILVNTVMVEHRWKHFYNRSILLKTKCLAIILQLMVN